MRRVQEILSDDTESSAVNTDDSMSTSSVALKRKRLTFAWLDGEAQKVTVYVYIMHPFIYKYICRSILKDPSFS